jgi:hypothetical protein
MNKNRAIQERKSRRTQRDREECDPSLFCLELQLDDPCFEDGARCFKVGVGGTVPSAAEIRTL